MPKACDGVFIYVGPSKSNPCTPTLKSRTDSRRVSSDPSVKNKLFPSTSSSKKLQSDHQKNLRRRSRSPSPTKYKSEKIGKPTELPLKGTGSHNIFNKSSQHKRNVRVSKSPSPETSESSLSDEEVQRHSRSKAESTKTLSSKSSMNPSAWSSSEILALWEFILSRGEGKFAWKDLQEAVLKASGNIRTIKSLVHRWRRLKVELYTFVEGKGIKDDPFGKSNKRLDQLYSRSTSKKSFNVASASRNGRASKPSVKEEQDFQMDSD